MSCLVAESDAVVGFAMLDHTDPEAYVSDADAE